MTSLFKDIETAITEIGHGWTSVEKGQTMAGMVLALRPAISLEIGVYAGKGLVSLGLAHKAVKHGMAVGIDPYSVQASIQGQTERNWEFWSKTDHGMILNVCKAALAKWDVASCTNLIQKRSDDVEPNSGIGILRVDGNHAEQALRDTMRFAPCVIIGGFLLLDDIAWSGGHVGRAAQWLKQSGWRELYSLDDGPVFQRVK